MYKWPFEYDDDLWDEYIETIEEIHLEENGESEEKPEEDSFTFTHSDDKANGVSHLELSTGQKLTLPLSFVQGIIKNDCSSCPACLKGRLDISFGSCEIMFLQCNKCLRRYWVFEDKLCRLDCA